MPAQRGCLPWHAVQGPGSGTRALGWRPLLLVVLIRMAVLPLIGAVVVVGFVKLGWYKPLDPVYAFILLQQVS